MARIVVLSITIIALLFKEAFERRYRNNDIHKVDALFLKRPVCSHEPTLTRLHKDLHSTLEATKDDNKSSLALFALVFFALLSIMPFGVGCSSVLVKKEASDKRDNNPLSDDHSTLRGHRNRSRVALTFPPKPRSCIECP